MSASRCQLLKLPWDIRHSIYEHIFNGALLTIEQEPHRPVNSPIIHVYRNEHFTLTLLLVCKQTHTESLNILASSTTVLLKPGITNPNNVIQKLPQSFISHIRIILNTATIRSRITHVLRQHHLDPAPFTNLRTYRVAHIVYPDWRDSCHTAENVEPFVQNHLESEFFFQAGTLRLFSRTRTYELTVTLWLLRAFVQESIGWEVEFSLDTWSIIRKRHARFTRHKSAAIPLCDDPKCRDYRNYNIEMLES